MKRKLNSQQHAFACAEGVSHSDGAMSFSKRHKRFAEFLADDDGEATAVICLCVTLLVGIVIFATNRGILLQNNKNASDLKRFDGSLRKRVLEVCGRRDDGSNLVETAIVLPLLILMLVGCVDYGRGSYAALEVSSAAEAGALYGALHPTDTSGMVSMAKLDAAEVGNLSATATYGCECADGSSSSSNCTSTPLCAVNVVQYVEVTTTAAYSPTLPYPGIPSSINLQNKVRLRATY